MHVQSKCFVYLNKQNKQTMKTYTTSQILSSYPSVNKTGVNSSKWYSALQNAKTQHGSRIEKIQMVMRYMPFDSVEEEDNCFNYLFSNLS